MAKKVAEPTNIYSQYRSYESNHNLINLRAARQHLVNRAGEGDYDVLFRQMSPVRTVYWCCPGEPPCLSFRADFEDTEYCFRMRGRREIVKGRFQDGGIAYIFADELELFGAAYRKLRRGLTEIGEEVLSVLRREGPMNIGLLKEFTGLLSKQISPALHKLQEEFIVFEDQADNEWDRAWYLFEDEFPDVDFERYKRPEAIKIIIERFAWLNVRVDGDMIRSFYRFPAKEIKIALEELEVEGKLVPWENGYIRSEDTGSLTFGEEAAAGVKGVLALHRNDFLVKSNEHWLKELYRDDTYDVLQYLLVDGAFCGAVLGNFHNGPFDVEDVILDLSGEEARERREEVIEAVRKVNASELSPLKRYQGVQI